MVSDEAKASYTYKIKSDTGCGIELNGFVSVCQHQAAEAVLCGAVSPRSAMYADSLLSAIERMCEEFRGYDLPYGSEAYTNAISVINRVKGGE